MSEFTIGGFAEDLISKELGKINDDPSYIAEATSSQPPQADVPDLRKVSIPSNFMSEVLGESTQEEVIDETVVEESSEDLFGKLQSLVRELDSVLTEMTMSGHIGVNMAGPLKKTKEPKSKGTTTLLKKLSRGAKTRYKRKGAASPPKGKAKHNPY